MASSVVQTATRSLVESATEVASPVDATTVAESKTVKNSVDLEAVALTDGATSVLLEKIKGGADVVGKEVTRGAETAVASVEAHPELIAEGAVAVVLGVATLIQPELAAGEVAVIGKMAAESAKKTVQKIATDTGSGVVKAISKDFVNDAAAERVTGVVKSSAASNDTATTAELPVQPSTETSSNVLVKGVPKVASARFVDENSSTVDPVAITATAMAASETITTNLTPPSDTMIATITQESLNDLHFKIDTMREAIQGITKLLELHLPRSQLHDVDSPHFTPILESSNVVDNVMAGSSQLPIGQQSGPLAQEEAPKITNPVRPVVEKRASMLGAVGKIFWPFGDPVLKKVTDGTLVQSGTQNPLAVNVIKSPIITTYEVSNGT